jgi:hypothetical protein
MARDTLSTYFSKRRGTKLIWHVWDVELYVVLNPAMAEVNLLSSEQWRQAVGYDHPVGIIKETLRNTEDSSGYTLLRHIGAELGDGLPWRYFGDEPRWWTSITDPRNLRRHILEIPADPDITVDGTKHLEYIHKHAKELGYLDDARHKAIYLLPPPLKGGIEPFGYAAIELEPLS